MAVARQPWEYVLHRNACMTLGISTHVVDLLTPDILLVLPPSLPFCSWRELFSDLVGKQHGGQEGHHHQAGCSTCARRQPGQVHPVPLPGYKHFQVGSWLCCGSALNSCGSGSKNLLTRIRILPLPNNRYVRCRYVFVLSLITLTFLDKKNPNFCLKIVQSR